MNQKQLSFKSVVLILLILLCSCQNQQKPKLDSIEGIWESIGYGRILKIDNGEFLIADITKFSCMELMQGDIENLEKSITLKSDTLSYKDGINIYYFTRLDDAPSVCKPNTAEFKSAQSKVNDPEHNFEVLWDTFKTHYAYFDLRDVDPSKIYNEFRPKVNPNTSEAELFFVMYDMLESFNDGHIDIDADDDIMEAALELYLAKYPKKTEDSDIPKLKTYQVAKAVADKYIPNGKTRNGGIVRWGILNDKIGYLQLNQMMGFANYGISDSLSYRDYFMAYFEKLETVENDNADELEGLNSDLDAIMKDFEQTEAIIIDLRFNGGGKDEVGMDVLKRFNNEEKIVFTKRAYYNNKLTPIINVKQPAAKSPYLKPVYLLTSPESASATEIMALSSLSMPNVTRIGDATEGIFSDILDKELPNGWEFGLSNEIYLDMNGNNYESIGIPADIKVPYDRDTQKFLRNIIADLEHHDLAIQKGLELIAAQQTYD